jgi:hypothetical protein
MADLSFKGILESNLPSDGNFTIGTVYMTDMGRQYLGITDGHGLQITDVHVVSVLPSSPEQDKIYILNSSSPWTLNVYDGTQWNTLGGSGGGFETVDTLPLSNIDTNKLYLLTTDSSINYYNGTTWKKYGTANITEIDNIPIDGSSRQDNTFLGYSQVDGKYEHRKITVSGIVGNTGATNSCIKYGQR